MGVTFFNSGFKSDLTELFPSIVLVLAGEKRFSPPNFNLKVVRIQHGSVSWMLLDALLHCWKGFAGPRLKNVMIVISKFLHYILLVTISGKRFLQQNFNLKMTRIQRGIGSWMLLDALFHYWEGSAGPCLKNVMHDVRAVCRWCHVFVVKSSPFLESDKEFCHNPSPENMNWKVADLKHGSAGVIWSSKFRLLHAKSFRQRRFGISR
jgi:hypothetical protein